MNSIMDKADLIFFKKRIDALKLEIIYTERIYLMINRALENFHKLNTNLELQHSLFYSLWVDISKICGMLFVREDDFFDTLRAIECEMLGRIYLAKIQLGWVVQAADNPEYIDDFLAVKFD